MFEYLGALLGMHQIDGVISSAESAEKKPKQVQSAPPPTTCNFKEINKIRECLDAKFKDDRDPHPEMWDPNWIKKP